MTTDTLAIICARGGSKGVPHKNIRILAGKPLISHTILHAIQAGISRVFVSTDDPKISVTAKKYGAEVIKRPKYLAGDKIMPEPAIIHVLTTLQKKGEKIPSFFVFLQCTSPLTSSDDIKGTIKKFIDEKADSALSVIPFHYFLWKENTKGEAVGIGHNKKFRPSRQEREPQFLETGAVYVMNTKKFLKFKHRFFGKTVMFETPPERRWEIDEPFDFDVAELLMQRRK